MVVQHDAKGMFPESHPSYIGCLFPGFSSPASIPQCYEAADGLLFLGTHFNGAHLPGKSPAVQLITSFCCHHAGMSADSAMLVIVVVMQSSTLVVLLMPPLRGAA